MKINFAIVTPLLLVLFFFPTTSYSAPVPFFDIIIIKNSIGAEGIFNFSASGPFNSENIEIETENGSGAGSVKLIVNQGGKVEVIESQQPGWQYAGINCFSNDPRILAEATNNGAIITAQPLSSITCIFTNIKQSEKIPVLIVPGLLGTEMKKGEEKLWPNILKMSLSLNDDFMDLLAFDDKLRPIDEKVYKNKVIKREPLFDYIEGLVSEFSAQGYTENETLFTFPYDWRYGISGKFEDDKSIVDLLKQKIQDILQQTGVDKVDIVAHSMGGLLVKKYVMENPTNHNIRKAVFVGVPNIGAPKAIKVLLQGDNFGIPWLNDSEIKKISKNMPSGYDLLPSEEYYNQNGSFVKVVDLTNLFNSEIKNLNYQETKSFIINDHSLNSLAFDKAENLHTHSFDNFDMRTAGVDVYNIAGCKTATLEKIVEVRNKNVFGQMIIEYLSPTITVGDGTVPLISAISLPTDNDHKYYILNSEHGKMLSQNGSRQQIVNIISGSNLPIDKSLVTQNINDCVLSGRLFSIFSPIDISVTDQNGNKLGLADDKSLFNEIPNADFEVWGEHKFIFLPTDNSQIYDIKIQGTGEGVCTIKVEDIQNSQTIQTEVFSNIPVTPQLVGQINLKSQTTTLSLDKDGDGKIEQVLEPSFVSQGEQPDDFFPPEAIIEFDPIAKDLKISGQDNISNPNDIIITDQDNIITLTDQSGNTTEITLKNKNRKISMKAEIKSLKYNGTSVDISKNFMSFSWVYDKKGNLKMLSQNVKSKNGYNILAIYDGKKTKLMGKDKNGLISKSFNGLKIIKVMTNKGDLIWSY